MRRFRQSQRGQHNAREAGAEFLQRAAARDGLSEALGQFIEFVVHNSPLVLVSGFQWIREKSFTASPRDKTCG